MCVCCLIARVSDQLINKGNAITTELFLIDQLTLVDQSVFVTGRERDN